MGTFACLIGDEEDGCSAGGGMKITSLSDGVSTFFALTVYVFIVHVSPELYQPTINPIERSVAFNAAVMDRPRQTGAVVKRGYV